MNSNNNKMPKEIKLSMPENKVSAKYGTLDKESTPTIYYMINFGISGRDIDITENIESFKEKTNNVISKMLKMSSTFKDRFILDIQCKNGIVKVNKKTKIRIELYLNTIENNPISFFQKDSEGIALIFSELIDNFISEVGLSLI